MATRTPEAARSGRRTWRTVAVHSEVSVVEPVPKGVRRGSVKASRMVTWLQQTAHRHASADAQIAPLSVPW